VFVVQRIDPPYPRIDVRVLPEQVQFIDPIEKAITTMQPTEIPFLMRDDDIDIGFFTLRPADSDNIDQLRGDDRVTLLSFMIDARQQGKGYASRSLAQLPQLAKETFPHICSIGLSVNCRNTQAYRLYEKNGFRDIGELYHGGSAGPQHIMVMDV
jgi:RimJ/RimL family protein N-acetyltransferase